MVYCQDGKSQHANKDKAFKVCTLGVTDGEEKARKEASDERLSQIGTGDRSRESNLQFPTVRVTDHRLD